MMLMRLLAMLALVTGLPGGASALLITQTSDVAAGQSASALGSPLLDWSRYFQSGTVWGTGTLDPGINGGGDTDPVSGNSLNGSHYLANWLDGVGFNASNGSAAPDLGINGPESFTLLFQNPVAGIGFAVATGLGNLTSEIDFLGATLQITTDTGETGILTLHDSGNGYFAWVTIFSTTPFQSVTFFEQSANIKDQYFGSIFAAIRPLEVPEPGTFLLIVLGVALMNFMARFHRSREC